MKMLESYINSLTDMEWLEFVFESAAIVSLPSAVCIDWAVTSIRDNRKRIGLAWKSAMHVLKTGSIAPRVIRSTPHQA